MCTVSHCVEGKQSSIIIIIISLGAADWQGVVRESLCVRACVCVYVCVYSYEWARVIRRVTDDAPPRSFLHRRVAMATGPLDDN